MKDSELRAEVLRFFREQERSLQKIDDEIDSIQVAVDNALKAIGRVRSQQAEFVSKVSFESSDRPAEAEKPVPVGSPALPEPGIKSKDELPLVLSPFEEKLTTKYNEDPARFRKSFKTSGFGAENVGDIFQTGGEPKFVRKEGGIYYLVEDEGNGYVVPDPMSPLNDSYIKSEGLAYLFEIEGYNMERQALVSLEKPAIVEESSGTWKVSSKGKIRSRI